MMRKRIGFIALILIMAISFTGFQKVAHANEKLLQFNDLNSSDWAWDSIYYLAEKKVVNGYGKGRFGPNDNVTRGQAATFLVRELYPDTVSTMQSPYSDLSVNHDFYKEIMVATEKGIFEGNESGEFNPDAPINRAAVAKILALAYGLSKGSATINFNDVKGHWGEKHISILSSNKIINGYTDKTYRPQKNVKRSEFAKMLAETLVHKNPSIWFTPVPRSANGYIPDKNKSYTFSSGDGNEGYTLRYRGLVDNQPVWDQHNTDGTMAEVTYEEDTDMAASMTFSDHSGISISFDPYLPYPLFVGKTWDAVYLMMGVFDEPQILSTITSTNATISTQAGEFQDVIEVTRADGITYYVAKGIGMIMAEEDGEKLFELTKIE